MATGMFKAAALLLVACGLAGTARAQDCASQFKSGGDAERGQRFETRAAVADLEADKAIAQLKQIGIDDGFQLGAEGGQGARRTLVFVQRPQPGIRGFDIQLAADAGEGQVSISIELPIGMQANPEVIRGTMCGMIARLDMSKPAAPLRQASAQPAGPKKVPGGSPMETCELNFRSSINPNVGRNYTSWAPMRNVDVAAAVKRLQMLGQTEGFSIDPPYRHGTETNVTIYRKALADAPGFPIHLVMEEGLAVISVNTRLGRREEASDVSVEAMLCITLGLATASAMPEREQAENRSRFRGLFTSQKKKRAQAAAAYEAHAHKVADAWAGGMDELMQQAMVSGKSIVIIPTLNLDAKYSADQAQEQQWVFRTDRTSTTIWQNDQDPGSLIRVGNDESFDETGLRGFTTAFTSGAVRYLVYVTNAGTYSIVGTTYEAPSATMPQLGSTQPLGRSPLGQATLLPVKNTEYYQTQEWFNASFSDRQVTDNYCSAVFVASGGCAQWGTSTYNVTEMTSPAGWQNVTKSRQIDGLVVSTKLKAPFASFKVGPSEVVMVDGFYASAPNANFNDQACELAEGNQVRCDLTGVMLTRLPARLPDIERNGVAQRSPERTARILRSARYGSSEVHAKSGALRGVLGQDYLLEAR